MANDRCPCCRQVLPAENVLRFDDHSRSVIYQGKSTALSPVRYRIVRLLAKHALDTSALVERVYADDENGGPEQAMRAMNVQIHFINRKLAPMKIVIRGDGYGRRGGGNYRLIYEG